jgi:hypothetical protein
MKKNLLIETANYWMDEDVDIDGLDEFTKAYIEAALWTFTDDEPEDKHFSFEDISDETLELMKKDCNNFQDENKELYSNGGWSDEQAGHDFWLTRNGHGAGFWDKSSNGGYDEEVGEKLSTVSKNYENMDLYIGDDGKIYS